MNITEKDSQLVFCGIHLYFRRKIVSVRYNSRISGLPSFYIAWQTVSKVNECICAATEKRGGLLTGRLRLPFLSQRSNEMFYRSMDMFSLATMEAGNANVNEYVSLRICFPYIEYMSSRFQPWRGCADKLLNMRRPSGNFIHSFSSK